MIGRIYYDARSNQLLVIDEEFIGNSYLGDYGSKKKLKVIIFPPMNRYKHYTYIGKL